MSWTSLVYSLESAVDCWRQQESLASCIFLLTIEKRVVKDRVKKEQRGGKKKEEEKGWKTIAITVLTNGTAIHTQHTVAQAL